MPVSQPARYGVLLLVSAFACGMLLLGLRQYQADRRAVEFVAQSAGPPLAELTGDSAGSAGADGDAKAAAPEPTLWVHVTGAVALPGVYHLKEGARVADAIAAAGGPLPDGMPDALNLADRLRDGDKIYVPTVQELSPPKPALLPTGTAGTPVPSAGTVTLQAPAAQGATKTPVQSTHSGSSASGSGGGKVNINTAGAEELEQVSGIGPVMAKAIVEYRTKHGPFKRLEDLDAVSGIGPKTLQKLLPSLTL